MPTMNLMSLDVLAGIRRLTGSYSHFWRWCHLQDTLSLATFLRACQLEYIQASSIETIEQAYHLALARVGVTHERLTCWPEDVEPSVEEVLHLLNQLEQAERGDVDVTTIFELSKDLRIRMKFHSYLLQSGLRVTPGKRAPLPPPRDLPGEVSGPVTLPPVRMESLPPYPPIERTAPEQSPAGSP